MTTSGFIRPRPIRVAFLVDECDDWSVIFDSIFADCYSRWGGRFSLIVPSDRTGPRGTYSSWLKAYDPDIIYSYVDLEDQSVATLYERFGPSFIVRHQTGGASEKDRRTFAPHLPVEALSSMSVALVAPRRYALRDSAPASLVDVSLDIEPPAFLQDNFGCYGLSHTPWPCPPDMANFVRTVTLASKKILEDPQLHPKPSGEVLTDEQAFWHRIARDRSIIGLTQLSASFCPRIQTDDHRWSRSVNLVVGSGFIDRLTFWNARSHYPVSRDSELVSLIVTKADLDRHDFFQALIEILRHRTNVSSDNSSSPAVTIRSATMTKSELADLSARFQHADRWKSYSSQLLLGMDDCLPAAETLQHSARYVEAAPFGSKPWHEFSFTEDRFRPPVILPRHMRDIVPIPYAARRGAWAFDIDVQREKDYSRFSNVKHHWRLPRRLRLLQAFSRWYQHSPNRPPSVPRASAGGLLCLFGSLDGELPEIQLPSDETVFRVALCVEADYWPFTRLRQINGTPIAYEIRPSDKGRYLNALLRLAGGLNAASAILLHKFWKEQFERLGGTAAMTDERLDTVIHTLKKRFRSGAIQSDEDWIRLGRLVLREAREVRLAARYLKFDALQAEFETFRNEFWSRNQACMPREEWDADEKRSLAPRWPPKPGHVWPPQNRPYEGRLKTDQ